METAIYDVVIIGGGPTGISCAIAAKEAGLRYLVLEKGVLTNSIYHFPINMTFFSTSKLLEIGNTPFISHADKPSRREALEYYRRVTESWGLQVKLYEEVTGLQAQNDHYQIMTRKHSYAARNVVVATGYYGDARKMGVPGEDLPKVKHYYDDAHPYIGQKLLVVGAANSACDVALETWMKGAHVTMAIREAEIYKGVKYWIRPNIENRIKEGSIKAYFNTTIREITQTQVVLNTPDGPVTIANDFVLAMTGYLPDYPFLESLGLQFTADENRLPLHNPETLESNLPGVYVAGVLVAGMLTSKLFIENTRHHGRIIMQNIQIKRRVGATE